MGPNPGGGGVSLFHGQCSLKHTPWASALLLESAPIWSMLSKSVLTSLRLLKNSLISLRGTPHSRVVLLGSQQYSPRAVPLPEMLPYPGGLPYAEVLPKSAPRSLVLVRECSSVPLWVLPCRLLSLLPGALGVGDWAAIGTHSPPLESDLGSPLTGQGLALGLCGI